MITINTPKPTIKLECDRCYHRKEFFYDTKFYNMNEDYILKKAGWEKIDDKLYCTECAIKAKNEIPEIIEFNYYLRSNKETNIDLLDNLEWEKTIMFPDNVRNKFAYFMYEVSLGIRWNTKTNEKWIISIKNSKLSEPIKIE